MTTALRRWISQLRRRLADPGMVTAELAACLPVLVLVLAAALTAVSVGSERVRSQDAAREVARAAARGDPGAVGLGSRVAPGSRISVDRHGADVVAVVRVVVRPLDGLLPTFTIVERAVAAAEPSDPAGGS